MELRVPVNNSIRFAILLYHVCKVGFTWDILICTKQAIVIPSVIVAVVCKSCWIALHTIEQELPDNILKLSIKKNNLILTKFMHFS